MYNSIMQVLLFFIFLMYIICFSFLKIETDVIKLYQLYGLRVLIYPLLNTFLV